MSHEGPGLRASVNDHKGRITGRIEPVKTARTSPKRNRDIDCRTVARTHPDDFRRCSCEKTQLPKIAVLGNDGEAVFASECPDRAVIGFAQTDIQNMRRIGIKIGKLLHEPRRQVLVEQQSHPAAGDISLRSRSAANARQARISSSAR